MQFPHIFFRTIPLQKTEKPKTVFRVGMKNKYLFIMKKVLMGSIVLTVFSVAIIIFQISCQKTAAAQTSSYTLPAATTSTLGGVIVGSGLSVNSSGVLSTTPTSGGTQQLNIILYALSDVNPGGNSSAAEYWTMNYDGTNAKKIPITFTTGLSYTLRPKLSPDGKTIFFTALDGSNYIYYLYSCSIDGSNLKVLLTKNKIGSSLQNIEVDCAY